MYGLKNEFSIRKKKCFLKINELVKSHQGFLFVIRRDIARKINEILIW